MLRKLTQFLESFLEFRGETAEAGSPKPCSIEVNPES
jgi:hypothetical protein